MAKGISNVVQMVSISAERQVESERRLRAVVRAANIEHLEGTWCFERPTCGPPDNAIAMVRDADGWCALVPARNETNELFGVTLTTFSPEIDNSGYVGWLATAIKQRLGSGVFVICGDNPARGGIFDYLGYPAQLRDAVRALLDELRLPPDDDPVNLDLRVFKVVESFPASEVTTDTWFEFLERGRVVEATYSGGVLLSGRLVGRREGDRIRAACVQLTKAGRLKSGTAEMRVRQAADGRMLVTEEYQWSDGTTGRNVLQSVEPRTDS
jgi:hypothetical protein